MSDNQTREPGYYLLDYLPGELESGCEIICVNSNGMVETAFSEVHFTILPEHTLTRLRPDLPFPADTAALIAEARAYVENWKGDYVQRGDELVDRLADALEHLSRENVRLQMRVQEVNQQ